jgi:hypothetical protein
LSTSDSTVANGNGNGVHQPQLLNEDPIERIIGELEEQLAPLASRRAQLEAETAEILRAEDRIRAGITALRTGAPKTKAKAGRPPAPAGRTGRPAQKTIDDIYAIIATAEEPVTIRDITEHGTVNVSRATIEKVIAILRSDERIRIAGQQGVARLYAPMPS